MQVPGPRGQGLPFVTAHGALQVPRLSPLCLHAAHTSKVKDLQDDPYEVEGGAWQGQVVLDVLCPLGRSNCGQGTSHLLTSKCTLAHSTFFLLLTVLAGIS